MSKVNTKAYEMLVQMGNAAKKAEAKLAKVKSERDGAYDTGVQAAQECKNLAEWEATIGQLEDNIRHNRDNLAVKFGADKRDKPHPKTGAKYKVPTSVTTVKAAIKFAFQHGTPLAIEGKARSFTSIRKENTQVRDNLREAAEAELTGADKLRADLRRQLSAVADKLAEMDEKALQALSDALAAAVVKPEPAEKPAARRRQKPSEAMQQAA